MARVQFRKPSGKFKGALVKQARASLDYPTESHTEGLKRTLHHARCVWQTREDTRGGRGLTNQEYGERNICKASETHALLNPKMKGY